MIYVQVVQVPVVLPSAYWQERLPPISISKSLPRGSKIKVYRGLLYGWFVPYGIKLQGFQCDLYLIHATLL